MRSSIGMANHGDRMEETKFPQIRHFLRRARLALCKEAVIDAFL